MNCLPKRSIGFLPVFFCSFSFVLSQAAADDAEWGERRVGPFYIQAEFPLNEIDGELEKLGRLYSEIVSTLRLPELRERIAIKIFADEARWRDFFRQKFSGSVYSRAMFDRKDHLLDRTKIKGYVYLCRNEKFLNDMRHECTHAILSAALRKSVPIWLDEGLAEYFEVAPENRTTNGAWLERTRSRLRAGSFQPINRLEKLSGMADMTTDAYGDSWAWVCFLLNGPARARAILPKYLDDLAARRPFAPSMSRRTAAVPDASLDTLRLFYLSEQTPTPP